MAHRFISLQGSASLALGGIAEFARANAVDDPPAAGAG
jgi:hypothetical protein